MRSLLARNVALRHLPKWGVVMLVGAQVVTGIYGYMAAETHLMTYTPLLLGAWILMVVYLVWGQAGQRGDVFDLALPLSARRLWAASLVGSFLAVMLLLAVMLGVVAAIFALVESLEVFDTLGSAAMVRAAAILLSASLCGVAWMHGLSPGLAKTPGGWRGALAALGGLLVMTLPMVLLNMRPWLLVPLYLIGAGLLVAWSSRRMPRAYVLAPRETAHGRSGVEARGGAAGASARPTRGLRGAWLTYMLLVRSAPKGPALLLLSVPFLLLFGALLSGLLQKMMPDSDLRFAYLPMAAYMALAFVAPVFANLRMVDALPLGRRRLLALISLPSLLLIACGYLGGVVWLGAQDFEMPRIIYVEEDQNYGVRVPRHMWRIAWNGEVPAAVAPWGESHPAMKIPLIKGATPVIYKPYTTPVGCSRDYAAWQIWRAAQAFCGTTLSPEEIAETYLWTDFEGKVRLKGEDLALPPGGFTVVAMQPGPYLPVALALVSVLLYLGLAFYAPAVRACVGKGRRAVRMWIVLGALLLVYLAPMILAMTRVSRPWVLEAAGVDVMYKVYRAVPGGYAGLWFAAVAVGAVAFEIALAAFRRVESPVTPDTCLWNNLGKGE